MDFDAWSAYLRRQQLTQNDSRSDKPTATPQRRPYRAFARSGQLKQIDQQIWRLHEKMVNKLLANPVLLDPIAAQLEQDRAQGLLRHSEYLFWHCAFACIHDSQLFRQTILSDAPGPLKYRRRTRLRGLLSEDERLAILQNGELITNSVDQN